MMKTKQYFKYSRLFFLLLVIGAGLMSCEDEDKYGKTAADSAKAVIESVRVMENEEWTPIVQVRIGTAVRIEGNNLENVSAVYFNGYEVVADDFTNFGKTYIEATVPEETPIGHQVADEAVKNTVRVVTDINEFTSALNIISKSLNISGIALYNSEEATVPGATTVSEAELGSKIQIQGAGLDFVTAVYFNGKQTGEKFISQSAGGITLHIPNDTPLGTNVEADADRNTITVETEFGEKFIYSFVIKGNPPTLAEVRSADGTEVITTTTTFGGEVLRLVGTHLETVTKVYCNGVEMTEFTAEAETIVLTLPADLPVGSAVKDESVKNTIRVVSDFGEAVLNLEFRGPAPIVDRVSHTLAKAGERIRIYGHNFANVAKVVFPGDVSVATKGTGEEPEAGTFIINEAGTTIDVIVPDGGDALAGALYVEAEADNGGYSYSYMNCKDNIFISHFNGDAYKDGGTDDICKNNAVTPTYTGSSWCKEPENFRAFGNFRSDAMTNKLSFEANRQSEDDLRKIGKHELTFNFYASRMLDKVPADIINCDDLAIQFDCYLENEQDNQWLTGAIKWNFRLAGSSDHEITFTPWHPNYNDAYKEVDRSFSEGWKTLTFPLKDFKHVGGETVADIKARILTLEGNNNRGFFMFAFAEFDYPTGSGNNRSRGEAVTNQLFYFGNFRIVPYTKPVE
ncbi:glycan-binding surface protein [Bacteroides clarus]|jgi:hypothetical protein|uniref:Surface glycan-binding protein B xyloglucan binding domain-containing protein n=1 Tax=Bacteroides clarus TaxID=626929 RepID=A0A1Y3YZC3_9BACE|nr:glycan-binding surface protein [Bacteroides clarus]OUO01809.1 hypothetical protein B5F97_06190 [Bacteroides clarus]